MPSVRLVIKTTLPPLESSVFASVLGESGAGTHLCVDPNTPRMLDGGSDGVAVGVLFDKGRQRSARVAELKHLQVKQSRVRRCTAGTIKERSAYTLQA
jgi:hypothetical protein